MPIKTRRAAQKPEASQQDVPSYQEEPSRTSGSSQAASSHKKRTNDVGSAAAVITTKKAKTSSLLQVAPPSEISTAYNLRSSARKPSAAATVTPANAGTSRRLAPFETPPAHNNTIDLTDSIDIPGVVDIYDPRQPCVSFHRTCNCPSDRSWEQGTDLAFAFLAHYGKGYSEIMKEREQSEHMQLLARLPRDPYGDDDDKENSSRRSRRSNKSDSDSKSSSSSSKHTPLPNTKFYPRELNLLNTSGSPSSEDDDSVAPQKVTLPRQPELTTGMRTMLVNWMVEVCKEYSISDDALHLSITLVDRALLMGPTEEQYDDWDCYDNSSEFFLVPKSSFQALGCACILIASKLEDRSTPKIEDLCYISDNSFSESRLRELEEQVCKQLSFRLSSVTPLHFINEFLRASHACPSRCCQFDHAVLRNVVLYILTLSRLSYELSHVKPSLLAAASVYLARVTLGMQESDPTKLCQADNPFWTKTLQHYTGYSLGQLKPIVLVLHKYQANAESTQDHKGIFAAFRVSARKNASLKTAVAVENLCLSNVRSTEIDMKAISAELF